MSTRTQRIVKVLNELRPMISKVWNRCLDEGFELEDGDDFINATMQHMSKYGWDTEITTFADIITLAFKET